ncbi:MAG: sulfite oxidase [SAR202 cluster bacterium]|nr:sulfite oxidase [SAR202 cluster bacterium]
MPVFVVTHQHTPERCPAGDPAKGPMLLRRLSSEGAERFGVTIRAEAMIDGQHTLSMIVEAAELIKVQEFMEPFAQGGSVSVQPANPCKEIVSRGHC